MSVSVTNWYQSKTSDAKISELKRIFLEKDFSSELVCFIIFKGILNLFILTCNVLIFSEFKLELLYEM